MILPSPAPHHQMTATAALKIPCAQATICILLGVPLFVTFMLALNFPGIARELRSLRVAAPKRVVEEDLALNPLPPVEATGPASPWD